MKREWPKRQEHDPNLHDEIFALGVISLNYSRLENTFYGLFCLAADLNDVQGRALFYRLQNDARLAILDDIMSRRGLPETAIDLIRYFARGFNVCALNRHALMHSYSGGSYAREGQRGLKLVKYTRSGEQVEFFATISELRTLADSMSEFSSFGGSLCEDISEWLDGHPFQPVAWHRTPPMPQMTDWQSYYY